MAHHAGVAAVDGQQAVWVEDGEDRASKVAQQQECQSEMEAKKRCARKERERDFFFFLGGGQQQCGRGTMVAGRVVREEGFLLQIGGEEKEGEGYFIHYFRNISI